MSDPVLLWFPPGPAPLRSGSLIAAVAQGPVIPVYVLDEDAPRQWAMGGASRWWLHHSLKALDQSLRDKGSRLILRRGKCDEQLTEIAGNVGAKTVHALHHYEPWWRNAEKAVGKRLDLCLHDGGLLLPPGAVRTGAGGFYKIYTPFWRALAEHMPPPSPLRGARADRRACSLARQRGDRRLVPVADQARLGGPFFGRLDAGEAGARANVAAFRDEAVAYDQARNLPSIEGTSRLSPHLHFGEVSPAYVWHRIADGQGDVTTFLKELVWRDYAHNIICQMPTMAPKMRRPSLMACPGVSRQKQRTISPHGRKGAPATRLWMRGCVSCGRRGWMHNRVRMIAASFLIKHLLIDWRHGARWFWDTLVDASYANNSVNWQWVAGSGVDANLFTRIMAPLTQSPKFGAADYIRQWVPELGHLDDRMIHDPDAFDARPEHYPAKIIGHREGRERALAAYRRMKA
jgi:deoxyribodipyrimidine photo-lyase